MFVFGRLASTWPVATGVTVHDDRAYFVAGLLNNNGAHLYCLDAAEGTLLWQQNGIGGHDTPELAGFSPVGLPTSAAGSLWIRRGAFSLRDGSRKRDSESGPYARYMGRFSDATLFAGGWRFFGDQNEFRFIKGDACGVAALPVGTADEPRTAAVTLAGLANGFAAWNAGSVVVPAMREAHIDRKEGTVPDALVGWDRAELEAAITAHFESQKGNKQPKVAAAAALAKPAWTVGRARFFACALSGNDVIATFGEWLDAEPGDGKRRWVARGPVVCRRSRSRHWRRTMARGASGCARRGRAGDCAGRDGAGGAAGRVVRGDGRAVTGRGSCMRKGGAGR